jgi:tetratricopeptide (TPR) repeat protein
VNAAFGSGFALFALLPLGAFSQTAPDGQVDAVAALAIRENTLGPNHPDTAAALNDLALLLKEKGDYDGAEPLYRRALAIREKALGPNHPDTAHSLTNLGLLLVDKGMYSDAERWICFWLPFESVLAATR